VVWCTAVVVGGDDMPSRMLAGCAYVESLAFPHSRTLLTSAQNLVLFYPDHCHQLTVSPPERDHLCPRSYSWASLDN
jgi:hypothetical protein